MYLLLFLHSEDRFLTPERIDEIVGAELPSQEQDPNGELQHIIGTLMVRIHVVQDILEHLAYMLYRSLLVNIANTFQKHIKRILW